MRSGCIIQVMAESSAERGFWTRYGIATGSVAVVFVLSMAITRFVPTDVSTLYLAAVMFSAWRSGLGPGLYATVISVAIASFFFLAPIYSFSLKAEGVVELIAFSLASVVISSLSAARERALARAERARYEAEEANLVKDEFLAAVSHELRTPLTTIKTLTRLLLKKDPAEDVRREYLEDIESECDRQIDLVHNLLDVSNIRGGGVKTDPGCVDAGQVLRECEKIERVSANERGHELTLDIAEDIPFIMADENALRRAICAITENAVKYTPEGGSISLRAKRDPNDEAIIEVADNGRGINEEDLPHVFERFYRGRRSIRSADSQEVSGIGLGLHLARELIEGMNGTIMVESHPGEGSVFKIKLPAWRDPETVTGETPVVTEAANG